MIPGNKSEPNISPDVIRSWFLAAKCPWGTMMTRRRAAASALASADYEKKSTKMMFSTLNLQKNIRRPIAITHRVRVRVRGRVRVRVRF